MSRCLAVIPARGGSKGLTDKNLRTVGGVPLVRLAVIIAQTVVEITDFVVSTDRERIAAAANTYHVVKRPPELSGDRVGDVPVLQHAVRRYEGITGQRFDEIVMLQPTSPLRTAEEVSQAIQMRRRHGFDSVWTVSQTDPKYHPVKALTVQGASLRYGHVNGPHVIARQDLRPVYHRNGVAYVLTRDCLFHQGTLMGEFAGALVLRTPQISIDDEGDLRIANFLASEEYNREDYDGAESQTLNDD